MTDVDIRGQIRGNIRPYFSGAGTDVQLMLSDGGALISVQALPERAELVKLGQSWGAAIPTGSAATYIAGWPTTAPALVMQNAEAAGGPTYIIERAWLADISAGATGGRSLVGQLQPAGITGTFTDNAVVLKHQLSGRAANYGGNAKFAVAAANIPIASQWFPLGNASMGATISNLGSSLEANVFGRLLVPPGAFLSLVGCAGTAAGTYIIGVEWHEVFLNLG